MDPRLLAIAQALASLTPTPAAQPGSLDVEAVRKLVKDEMLKAKFELVHAIRDQIRTDMIKLREQIAKGMDEAVVTEWRDE